MSIDLRVAELRTLSRGIIALALAAALGATPLHADTARGVNPADNITKIEFLPKLTVLDDAGGISISTLTFKYDRAIHGTYGVNVELPLARFESPFGSDNGFGDLNLRGRAQRRFGAITGIGGVEAVIPTASEPTLGTGKYQLNPTVVAVAPFSKSVFTAAIAKHFLSIAGYDDRDDIVQGQYRALTAWTGSSGWWVIADPQLWVDYDNDGRTEFALEGELGKMVGPMAGAWLRGGGHVAGDWDRQEWTVSGGVRLIVL